jgi:predicted  nucleic acid-binding Zn-ribbon protein|tara:strand:+ start:1054 stop:1323 length:270 start_codon:yes stop_codon:yes gene_type:complete
MDLKTEIEILKDNISDMQRQLQQAHVRIKELVKEKGDTQEELIKERQFIQEITGEQKRVSEKLESKMNDYMSSIPDVVDSKPQVLKEGE